MRTKTAISLLACALLGCRGDRIPASTAPVVDAGPDAHPAASALDASPPVPSVVDAGPPPVIEGYGDFGCAPAPVVPTCAGGYCRLPAGCFVMGAPAGSPLRAAYGEDLHKVTFSHAAWIGQKEFTRSEFAALGFGATLPTTDRNFVTPCEGECPAGVSFFDALAIANALSAKETRPLCYDLSACHGTVGVDYTCEQITFATSTQSECAGYRLPTRAEFEFAMRAGQNAPFPGGDYTGDPTAFYDEPNLRPWAWYAIDGNGIHPVGQKLANGFGLYDIFGNAFEWVVEGRRSVPYFREEIDPEDTTTFAGTLAASLFVVSRGGAATLPPYGLRSTARLLPIPASTRSPGAGFRLIRSER